MICFFTITIYHNLASTSLLTNCFIYKKLNIRQKSGQKILNNFNTLQVENFSLS